MGKIIKEAETRVLRTYRGGALLDKFLGKNDCIDNFYPEDWISSFVEAKNKEYTPMEGLSLLPDGRYLTDVVDEDDFGKGRKESGVLIKLLDSAERLGIQVHPTDAYAKQLFGTPYGKTECWYVLGTRDIGTEPACVYLGFKPGITKKIWSEYYKEQNISAMLSGMNKILIKPGDTILVKGGMPHAIGGGSFLLEIQQPTDYTMRCETVPLSGEPYTPMQIHYGAGEEAMLNCFNYSSLTEEQMSQQCLLKAHETIYQNYIRRDLVTYQNTPYFALSEYEGSQFFLKESFCLTILCLSEHGCIKNTEQSFMMKKGDRFFISADTAVKCENCKILVCFPPQINTF